MIITDWLWQHQSYFHILYFTSWLSDKTSQQTFFLMKTSWRRLLSSSSENVFKTSSRWLDQEEYIRLSHSSSEVVLVKTNIFVLAICFQEFLLRRLQDVFKTSSRHLQDVFQTFWRLLQDIFKTSWKDVFKTFSRRIIKLNCSC